MPQLEVSNDFFIRTTDPEHKTRVQAVLQRVHDNGYTYKGLYEGWYCPRCADFKVENEILEGNRCPIHEIAADARAGGELVLPPVRLPGARSSAVRRAPRLRAARRTATTRRARSSPPASRTCRCRGPTCAGASSCPGIPSHVFYVWFGGRHAAAAMPSWASPEITGALPLPETAPQMAPAGSRAAPIAGDKLPATIGGPALRAAALSGDPAAAYEVAMRFAEGHGVQQNDEAALLARTRRQAGLAPAQFRLGGLYEKGSG